MRWDQVIVSYFRDESLKILHERPFAHGAHHLHNAFSVMFPRQLPETREREGLKQIGTVDVRSAIAFPLEGEHGVGSGVDGVIDHARKMNTKEWKEGKNLDFTHADAVDTALLNRFLWQDRMGATPMPPPQHNVFPPESAAPGASKRQAKSTDID